MLQEQMHKHLVTVKFGGGTLGVNAIIISVGVVASTSTNLSDTDK